jgi:ferrous-iron efflux pump FieF
MMRATTDFDTPWAAQLRADRLRRWSSNASFAISALLVIAKGYVWLATDSLSLLASVVDAVVDVVAALVTALGVRFAMRPADAAHRFGHGKAESLAALTQAILLFGATGMLILDSVDRLIRPHAVDRIGLGLAVIAGSTLVTGALVFFENYVAMRTRSQAIAADRMHHLTDVAANLAALLALGLTRLTGWPFFDPLFAMGIAIFFGWTAIRIAHSAAQTLLDRELPEAQRQFIIRAVMAHSAARAVHDLRTRRAGAQRFIEFHLELDGSLSLLASHAIADEVEQALKIALPGSEIIVHVEPAGILDDRLDDRLELGSAGPTR